MNKLSPSTKLGTVALIVADLERSLRYYQHNIGLCLQRREANMAWLGAGDTTLLQLTEQPGARPVQHGRTGLYHFAILTPSRLELGRTLRHLIESQTPVGGASDHAVSEALYLTDPDGHGIEIYRDRPRSEWQFPSGTLKMTIDPFDTEGVLAAAQHDARPWAGLHADTIIGHVHLHVANIPAAERFYVEVLGFDLMVRYGVAASFVAAGSYHHHLGLNTWAGVGAPPPPSDAARLAWYEVRLPDAEALQQTVARVQQAGWPIEQQGDVWVVRDSAQNAIHLS